MDSLYEDLENYEDVNVIQDLKNENTELKIQLERYSSTLNQLQIDFDKLTLEYKKLEMNYSSLLKTARVEIEKKTNMIKQLNIDKDMLVIQTFKNKGKRIFSNVHNNNIKPDCSGAKCEKSFNKDEITPVENIRNRDRLEKKQGNNSTDTKENIINIGHSKNSQKIMNRRKSMPVVSYYENKNTGFNSEGENQQCHPSKYQRIREHSSDRRSNKTLCMDDKNSNYSISKDPRRSRYSSYHNENKTRSRDKSRHRQYKSPERITCNNSKESYYQQNRRSRSPPSDRYMRYKSRDRHPNYNDYSTRNERHVIKHKLQPHSEEPDSKKIKIDSYGQYLKSDKDLEDEEFVSATQNLTSPEDPYRSSQSPDRVNPEEDNNEQSMVKEIVHISTTPLQDPRLKSNKYVLHNENGKEVLKKCNNDIYMKIVDKSIWKMPNVIVPDALLQKPPSASKSEIFVTEIRPNIDNLNLDITFQSIDNDIGSPNINVIPTELSANGKEIYEEEHYEHLDLSKEKVEYSVNTIKNKTINDTPVEHVGCLSENDLHDDKTTKNKNQQDLPTLHLPNITSKEIQPLQDVIVSQIIQKNSTPNFKSHKYQELEKVSLSTVEGDLLLSDDDNVDFQKQNISQPFEKNPSSKIKIKCIRADKNILGDKNSYYEDKGVNSDENMKNKENPVDIEQQSHNNRSKKDYQAGENLCEKRETCCDESIPFDVVSGEVKDTYSGHKRTKNNSADKMSYSKKNEPSGGSQTVKHIKDDVILCARSIELGKSKFMDSERNADSDCEVKDTFNNQINSKYTQEAKDSSDEARHTYETIKIGLVDNVSQAVKKNPGTDTRTIPENVTDVSKAEIDKGSHKKIIEGKDETSKNLGKRSGDESEIMSNIALEIPYKKEKSSRKSKAKKDILIDEILPEGKGELRSKTRPLYKISHEDSIKGQVKEICKSQIVPEGSQPFVAITCIEKYMHRSEMDIKDYSNFKSSDLSKIARSCQNQDIEKIVETKTESESTNKKHRAKKKPPDTKVIEQSKDKLKKKSSSKKGKEIKTTNIKPKFSDLFGDSNSLIMPEDLGISNKETTLKPSDKFVSIFDDTQSAVDLSLEHAKQNEKDSDKMLETIPDTEEINVRNCLKNVSNIDQSFNSLVGDEHISDNVSIIHNDKNSTDKGNLYENLNPATSMDGSNVIVISMGVQSNCDITKDEVNNIENFAPKSNPLLTLKALATSTPLKIDVEPTGFIDKNIQNNVQPQEPSGTDVTNSAVPLKEPDVPDIRIFVKRRRKNIRKP